MKPTAETATGTSQGARRGGRLGRRLATVPVVALLLTGSALVGTASAHDQGSAHDQASAHDQGSLHRQDGQGGFHGRGGGGPANGEGNSNDHDRGRGMGPPVTLACGAVITHNIMLANNVGPCTGDGLTVDGSNIRIDLRGHTITGSHQGTISGAQQVGINLNGVTGDTVEDGAVQYFDTGVAIQGGSGNTVRGINAHDNINRDVLVNAPQSAQTSCDYGDGIAAFNSSDNRIVGNTVAHNGPFDGIGVVGNFMAGKGFVASDHNLIAGNRITDNYVADQTPNGGGTNCGSSMGALYGGMGSGRQVQDMGVRIEGPDASYNVVRANQVTRNGLDGIAVFDYFCNLNNPSPTAHHEPANHDNSIVRNFVSGTGDAAVQAASGQVDPSANGIAILAEGNSGVNCTAYNNTVAGNTSIGNIQDGIFVGGAPSEPSHPQHTTVVGNLVNHNSLDGLAVQQSQASPGAVTTGTMDNVLTHNVGHGNTEFDGADYNFPNCGTDVWYRNFFGSVNQLCVANGGTGTIQQVILTNENGIATGLQTNWTSPVTVTNPAGFTLYSDATCSTLTGTGQSVVSGTDGTAAPTVSFNNLPAPGTAYFEIAANSVTAPGGAANKAVPCTTVQFTGTPTTDTITGVTITGTIANPVFTVTGTGFGTQPPAPNPAASPDGTPGCPTVAPGSPTQGFLYGTSLYVMDTASNGFNAGKFTPGNNGESDCVGLVIQSWSNTQVVFTFGDTYNQNVPGNHYVLANGDPVQVVVLGAVGSTTVNLPS